MLDADVAKVGQLQQATARYAAAVPRVLPGSTDRALINELLAIRSAYEGVLASGPPSFPFYTPEAVKTHIAETTGFIARAYESLRAPDLEQAATFYEQAAQEYDGLGNAREAARSRAHISEIALARNVDIDAEIERLRSSMPSLESDPLLYAGVAIPLGELQSRAGDDFAATETLLEVERLLDTLGGPPGADAIRDAYPRSMEALFSGAAKPGDTELERAILLRNNYLRVYLALAQAYRDTDPRRASTYEARASDVQSSGPAIDEVIAGLSKSLGG